MGVGVADVTTWAQAPPPDGLRLRALDSGTLGVLGGECGGGLPWPCGWDGLVLGLRPAGALPRGLLGLGARRADWTGAAGRALASDAHPGIARDIPAGRPSDAGVPLGTAGVLRLPVDDEGAQSIAWACPPLMTIRPQRGADHVDLMLGVGGDESGGIHRAAIAQMHAREEITLSQVSRDGRPHDAIRGRRRGGHDPREEVRLIILTGFGDVDLLADPREATLGARPGLDLRRGGDQPGGRQSLRSPPPAQGPRWVRVLGGPDRPSCLNGRDLT